MKHLRTLEDLTLEQLEKLLSLANEMDKISLKQSEPPITVANLFFEPSTRTKCSFEMAQKELGLHSLHFETNFSSVQKGETLYDTVKTLESIGVKAVVIRHPEKAYYKELENINIPIVNAGDGAGDHPSQSLLDLLTIQQEFVIFQGLHIVICGDIRHSRVARTNANILRKLGSKVSFAGPEEWMDREITKGNVISMDKAVKEADVMMMLRIQTERHDMSEGWTKEAYHEAYGLTVGREKLMKKNAVILHPAPVNRDVEIASELVECDRSRIFKQMKNGVLVRKAILAYVLNLLEVKKYERVI
ncbi:aspartate carbamoyltransferase catalytic subunit [Evansella sp. AB-P1]|uniref:aspartate carbamoyltransferase catalytic subunit n=1 Tax=Evansella sp. AB-P1 TaxID=3037653 RepID=UPI00241D9613|nr:aspartate carbamoyltransferase catalytic subunit [Evansella sp. AB-P1]MDG5788263.1 aspartate carbamoyltransferase catalytic subunit [Evansella sp. AB-P1]